MFYDYVRHDQISWTMILYAFFNIDDKMQCVEMSVVIFNLD